MRWPLILLLTSCAFHVVRERFDTVKKVAVVRYAVQPGKGSSVAQDVEAFAKGMSDRFEVLNDVKVVEAGEIWLPPQTARALCESLNVDAVVTLSGRLDSGMGTVTEVRAENGYTVDAYDRTGDRVWSDRAIGLSHTLFPALSQDEARWIAAQGEAFESALSAFKKHLER